jgi:hypothetical protein
MAPLHSLSVRPVLLVVLAAFFLLVTSLVAQTVNPVPLVNQPLVPTSVVPGAPGLTLTVNGTGFVATSVVNWNGTSLSTTFVNFHQLVADVPVSNLASANTASVTVSSPAPGGGTSNAVPFTITGPTSLLTFVNSTLPVGTEPQGVVVADFNGDGKSDLAVFNLQCSLAVCGANASGSVSILLGNGNGTFTLKSTLTPTTSGPISGVVGDFNNDGKLDLAVISEPDCMGCANGTIFLGNGDGTFTEGSTFLEFDGDIFAIATADFNKDGNLDLAVSYIPEVSNVEVFLGNGTGFFTDISSLSDGGSLETGSLAVGDFNNDGIIDIASVGAGGVTGNNVELGPVTIFLGNGDGTFTLQPSQPAVTLVNPASVTAGDFNGDGILDLAIADAGSTALTILKGNGDGTFTQVSGEPALPQFSNYVTAADLNGDGKLDLVFSNSCGTGCTANTISIFLSNGDGTFQAALTETVGNDPQAVAVGDFNGDGRLDLAVTNSSDNTVSILLQTRAQSSATIASSSNPSVFEQPLTFTAIVTSRASGTPTGTVTFTYGSTTLCNAVALSGGTATCEYSGLPVGSDVVTATYNGDDSFTGTSASLNQTVNQESTMLALGSSVNPSGLDQPVTFTAAITFQYGAQASGTVTFQDGSTTLGSAALNGNGASLTTSGLAVGRNFITAVYSGDSNFTGSTSNILTQLVTKATTATTLFSSVNPSVFGKWVSLTATVSSLAGTPTGKVQFLSGATILATVTLKSGSAKYGTLKLRPGANSITAVYEGDTNNSASTSAPLNQIVLAPTTTTLTSSPNSSAYGQTVVFTASVTSSSGAPPDGGTVTFKEGATALGTGTLGGGTASFATSTLGVGTKVITAVYGGDATFATSRSELLSQVICNAASTTTLVSSLNPSNQGQPVTFTATVSPQSSGMPTGTVIFQDGTNTLKTVTLSGGAANYTTSKLATGTHNVSAIYNGNSSFTTSSAALTQTVN